MALPDLSCPICNADLTLDGDEKKGDEVYCSYCGAPSRLTANVDSEDCDVEDEL